MGRNGGAPETWWQGTSIASATCTVAATVQESLWKIPHLQYPLTSLALVLEVRVVPHQLLLSIAAPHQPYQRWSMRLIFRIH
jgi:hypothetical protein